MRPYPADHFALYLAEEMVLAGNRAQERLKPHLQEMYADIVREVMEKHIQTVAEEFVAGKVH